MAAKNDRSGAASLARLKKELAAGVIGRFYLFYGEEAYLREHYIGQIKKRLVADDENNFCNCIYCAGGNDFVVARCLLRCNRRNRCRL